MTNTSVVPVKMLSRAEYDYLIDVDQIYLLRLLKRYDHSWSLYGVTFRNVSADDACNIDITLSMREDS